MVLSKEKTIKHNLQDNFACCRNYMKTLFEVTCERNTILHWFQGLCQHLIAIITSTGSRYKEIKETSTTSTQNTLLLYLSQIITLLSLLINIFVCEEEIRLTLVEARKCIFSQMTCCLESIEVAIDCNQSVNDPSGSFVKWMDAALEKIAEINTNDVKSKTVEKYEETRQLFEEVLSHAMSIAQVSLIDDSKMIRGSCQSVLSTLNSLEKEVNNPIANGAMVNLFIDACSDKLCTLEKKVNTAVLKLCLKTFSQFTLPLDRIHSLCFNLSNRSRMEELDTLVADFDLHVDRIVQIGLFAVSCSSNMSRGIKIRSCLASLEALESELVPAMTSVVLDNSVHNISCASLLMKHWVDQAFCLQKLIYLIVDPFAFCQVIYEEAENIVDNLSTSVRKNALIHQKNINCLIETAKVLQTFLNKAKSEFNENETNKMQTKLKDFNEVLEEVETASKILLNDEHINIENSKRVLKRCKILLTVLKRLWYCFADDIIHNKNISLEKQVTNLQSKCENLEIEPTGNGFLDHIIKRGKQILQDRSVLYRTPIKAHVSTIVKSHGSQLIKCRRKEVPLLKLVHLRKFSFINVSEKNETSLDLQITDILKEMTNLSTSLAGRSGRD